MMENFILKYCLIIRNEENIFQSMIDEDSIDQLIILIIEKMIVENHRFLQYFPLKIQFVFQKINPYVIAFFSNNPKMKIKNRNQPINFRLTSTKFFKCPK